MVLAPTKQLKSGVLVQLKLADQILAEDKHLPLFEVCPHLFGNDMKLCDGPMLTLAEAIWRWHVLLLPPISLLPNHGGVWRTNTRARRALHKGHECIVVRPKR